MCRLFPARKLWPPRRQTFWTVSLHSPPSSTLSNEQAAFAAATDDQHRGHAKRRSRRTGMATAGCFLKTPLPRFCFLTVSVVIFRERRFRMSAVSQGPLCVCTFAVCRGAPLDERPFFFGGAVGRLSVPFKGGSFHPVHSSLRVLRSSQFQRLAKNRRRGPPSLLKGAGASRNDLGAVGT